MTPPDNHIQPHGGSALAPRLCMGISILFVPLRLSDMCNLLAGCRHILARARVTGNSSLLSHARQPPANRELWGGSWLKKLAVP